MSEQQQFRSDLAVLAEALNAYDNAAIPSQVFVDLVRERLPEVVRFGLQVVPPPGETSEDRIASAKAERAARRAAEGGSHG